MEKDKTEKGEKVRFWPYNPGYNLLVGYKEGKPSKPKSGGLKELAPDREVKDGKSLNK